MLSRLTGMYGPSVCCTHSLCFRMVGKNEAAGAAVAALCHTQDVWAGRDRNIGFTAQSPNCMSYQ
jgi:hypothetical protein